MVSCGKSKKWLDQGYMLKVDLIRLSDELNDLYGGRRAVKNDS